MCDCAVLIARDALTLAVEQEVGEQIPINHLFYGHGAYEYPPDTVFLRLADYTNQGAPWWDLWVLTPDGNVVVGASDHYDCDCSQTVP